MRIISTIFKMYLNNFMLDLIIGKLCNLSQLDIFIIVAEIDEVYRFRDLSRILS